MAEAVTAEEWPGCAARLAESARSATVRSSADFRSQSLKMKIPRPRGTVACTERFERCTSSSTRGAPEPCEAGVWVLRGKRR
jgi:hypothetical protein